MRKQTKNNGIIQPLFALLLVIGVAVAIFVLLRARPITLPLPTSTVPSATQNAKPINTTSDLDKSLKDLDTVDTSELDKGMSENSTDASGF